MDRGAVYGTIVVVGGGCYGSYYVRQLLRAARAGALTWERLVVVDHSADCSAVRDRVLEAAGYACAAPELALSDWRDFFTGFLGARTRGDAAARNDAIVPSPLMPHLMYEWLLQRAAERWPLRSIATRPLDSKPPFPWETSAPDGTHYVSFATWTCPVNCIEPALCPHTRGDRSWSMPPALAEYAAAERAAGKRLEGPLVFHCTHRAYGVGMIPVADVIAADRAVRYAAATGAASFLVGTVSHCHGALNLLEVGASHAFETNRPVALREQCAQANPTH